ncbi:hypothetical protein BDW74DRAFT_172596 [Aspergillus multicolor]|uniref:uncharacterized protein n=1 Tax=Aspergillus multicolor TaxID=41759 RepID=UPI003CCE15DE
MQPHRGQDKTTFRPRTHEYQNQLNANASGIQRNMKFPMGNNDLPDSSQGQNNPASANYRPPAQDAWSGVDGKLVHDPFYRGMGTSGNVDQGGDVDAEGKGDDDEFVVEPESYEMTGAGDEEDEVDSM